MKRGVLIPIVLALMLIVALAPVAMAGPLDDTIIESNETVNNDVIVLDGAGGLLTQRDGLDAPSWAWQAGDPVSYTHLDVYKRQSP